LDTEVTKVLNDNYVCVYVDRSSNAGQRLAADFEMAHGPGIVLSSRAGDLQAFRHSGEVSNEVLAQQLRRFADANLVVKHTETLAPVQHTSFYPANGQVAPAPAPYVYPTFYPQFGGGGGCAGGRCR
jgi:hypothetical protein